MDHGFPFGSQNAHKHLGIMVDEVIDILQTLHIGSIELLLTAKWVTAIDG
jgi:hypothetical protein